MNLSINTESLLNILLPLQPIINDNHTVPVLQNVKLDFNKNSLTATGNNLEVVCKNSFEETFKEEVSFCVNFTMLLAIVKSVTDKKITFSISKKEIQIIHTKGKFDLPVESTKEFPAAESESFIKKAKVKGTSFRSALKVANKFILSDDLDAMANISLSIGNKIFIRSTDRNRLFEEKLKGAGDEANILISGKASLALSALLESIEGDVEMVYNSNSIFFKFDNKEIMVVQQQGIFPIKMFSKILDTMKETKEIKVNSKSLTTALKRVSIMSLKEKFIVVKLDVANNKMIISCSSDAFSTKGKEELTVGFKGELNVSYNYKFIIEILSVFEEDLKLFVDPNGLLFIKQNKKKGALAPVVTQK